MSGTVSAVNLSLSVSSSMGIGASAAASVNPVSTVTQISEVRNPQIVQDPLAGVITQYVNMESGNVTLQFPSAKVVAYLRQGLSATGLPLQSGAKEPVTA